MFVFGDLFISVATILDYLLGLYKWIVIIAALISWVNPDRITPLYGFSMRSLNRCSGLYAVSSGTGLGL